jgi:hypothetical protein
MVLCRSRDISRPNERCSQRSRRDYLESINPIFVVEREENEMLLVGIEIPKDRICESPNIFRDPRWCTRFRDFQAHLERRLGVTHENLPFR